MDLSQLLINNTLLELLSSIGNMGIINYYSARHQLPKSVNPSDYFSGVPSSLASPELCSGSCLDACRKSCFGNTSPKISRPLLHTESPLSCPASLLLLAVGTPQQERFAWDLGKMSSNIPSSTPIQWCADVQSYLKRLLNNPSDIGRREGR